MNTNLLSLQAADLDGLVVIHRTTRLTEAVLKLLQRKHFRKRETKTDLRFSNRHRSSNPKRSHLEEHDTGLVRKQERARIDKQATPLGKVAAANGNRVLKLPKDLGSQLVVDKLERGDGVDH